MQINLKQDVELDLTVRGCASTVTLRDSVGPQLLKPASKRLIPLTTTNFQPNCAVYYDGKRQVAHGLAEGWYTAESLTETIWSGSTHVELKEIPWKDGVRPVFRSYSFEVLSD